MSVSLSRSGAGRYLKVLFSLAIPVMLEQLSQIFLGTVDTYFAGRISDDAIAAINASNMYMNLFSGAFASLSVGILVLMSQSLGRGDTQRANRVVRQAILMGLGVGAAFGVILLALGRQMLAISGCEGDLLDLALTYYRVVCVPCVFLCLTLLLSGGLKAAQNTKASMRAALAANLVNAVLDAAFVHMGLGVFGLGLATTLSRALNVALLLQVYRRGCGPLKLSGHGWKVDLPLMAEIVRYSLPVMFTQIFTRFTLVVNGSLILHLGSSYYVANSIATQLINYNCLPNPGFEAATAALVGSSVGAGDWRNARQYARYAALSSMTCMTLFSIILSVFSLPLAGLFTETELVKTLVSQVMLFMVFFEWSSGLSHVTTSAVQGTGDTKYPLYVTFASDVLMRLVAGYFFAYIVGWKLVGIWAGAVLCFMFRSLLLGRRFFSVCRKKQAELSQPAPAE